MIKVGKLLKITRQRATAFFIVHVVYLISALGKSIHCFLLQQFVINKNNCTIQLNTKISTLVGKLCSISKHARSNRNFISHFSHVDIFNLFIKENDTKFHHKFNYFRRYFTNYLNFKMVCPKCMYIYIYIYQFIDITVKIT